MGMSWMRVYAYTIDKPNLDAAQSIERGVVQIMHIGGISKVSETKTQRVDIPVILVERQNGDSTDRKRAGDFMGCD